MKKTILIIAAIFASLSLFAQGIGQPAERNYKHPAEFEKFLSFKTQWNVNDTLPRPVYKQGTATVTGKIFGLPENSNCKISVSPRGVLDGDEKEFETRVNADGSFQITVPLTQSISPALIRADGERMRGFAQMILLADGEPEPCDIFFDEGFFQYHLPKDFAEGKEPGYYPTPIVFCGSFSDINNAENIDNLGWKILGQYSSEHGRGYDEAYQQAYLTDLQSKIDTINAHPISPRAKEYLALEMRTAITSELVQNCMMMEMEQHRRIWYPRSIYRFLKDENFFPTKNNRMMLSSHLGDYGSYLYHGFRSDSINLSLYGEKLDQKTSAEDVNREEKAWREACYGGDRTIFADAVLAYQIMNLLDQQIPFDSATVAYLNNYREPAIAQIFLTQNEENIARSQRAKGNQAAVNLPDFQGPIIDCLKQLHAGRFIYIDIWATWCSPCRRAIAEMQPHKPDFKAQNVDFVYLTDESSPLEAWQNQILDIDGEHFRITKQQMEDLFQQYGFKGWPSYIIISPKGETLYQSADAYLHEMPKVLREAIENAQGK